MLFSNKALLQGLPAFKRIAPGVQSLLPKPIRTTIKVVKRVNTVAKVVSGQQPISEAVANAVDKTVFKSAFSDPFKDLLASAAESNMVIKNGFGGYSWFTPKKSEEQRQIEKMVVVFHDANKAGSHVDVHVGNISFVYRVPKGMAKTGRGGKLTKQSQKDILSHLRDVISKGSKVPQNLDHSHSNARMEWFNGGKGIDGYGAGKIRQVILEEPVEILSTDGQTTKVYAPALNKHFNVYFHRLGKVVSVGTLKRDAPELKPKLDLKMVQNVDEFLKKVDHKTITLKEDSAAAYLVKTPKGTRIFSPRVSKETGKRIEYTGKLPELATQKGNFIGIGELKFRKSDGSYLKAAEAGGVLNSDKVRPESLKPEIFLYRADQIDGKDVSGLDFFANRAIQETQTNDFIKLVKLVPPDWTDGEGLVGVPPGGSINDGFKKKWQTDPDDWEVISNGLKFGPTGRTAGVVWFKSLESGREFKLGPGQIGTEKRVKEWMALGKGLVGRVAKVNSRRGHEGRASRFVEWHLDK